MWQARTDSARRQIAALATAGLDVAELHAEALRLVRTSVPYDRACWAGVDPDSLMMTSVTNWPPWPVPAEYEARFAETEYSGTEPNAFARLLQRGVPVARMSDVPHREVVRSARLNELLRPGGLEHELRAAFRIDGACWAVGGLFREPGADFTDREVEFLVGVAPALAAATRVAVRTGAHGRGVSRDGDRPDGAHGPIIVLADPTGELRAATPAAKRWLAELDALAPGRLAMTLYAVVAGARAAASGTARARMRDTTGGWVVLQASRLIAGDDPEQMVVTVEPARGQQLVRMLLAAYGLSAREQEVCLEVLAGRSTADIADRLFISTYTVQDHLKAIFMRVGVHSRAELVATLRDEA